MCGAQLPGACFLLVTKFSAIQLWYFRCSINWGLVTHTSTFRRHHSQAQAAREKLDISVGG